ncbi:MAG: hypothetical protein JST47_11495 [Bacteroidetes bacterium]|nr:hypothetical protein [Bacteroidota bacterium]
MKTNQSIPTISSGKVFFKLTALGCFLLGFAYTFLLMFNSVLKAMH